MKSGLHFLVAARQCEIGELEQLMRTSALVNLLGQLIHVLQKERGLSNIYLTSGGLRGAARRQSQIDACKQVEQQARAAFDHLDTGAARIGNGARLFSRIAYVLQGLDALPALRDRITTHATSPEAATAACAKLISGLLAVVFEAADSATDPEISRLLVATFNFMQGKEFAGQERATGATAFGAGVSDATRQQHWLHLIDSQDRCFKVFADFSQPAPLALWQTLCAADGTLAELERLRRIGCTAAVGDALDAELSQVWFDCCTHRMDAMQSVEAHMAADLLRLCESKVTEARTALQSHQTLLDTLAQTSAPPTAASTAPSAAFFDTPRRRCGPTAAGVRPAPRPLGAGAGAGAVAAPAGHARRTRHRTCHPERTQAGRTRQRPADGAPPPERSRRLQDAAPDRHEPEPPPGGRGRVAAVDGRLFTGRVTPPKRLRRLPLRGRYQRPGKASSAVSREWAVPAEMVQRTTMVPTTIFEKNKPPAPIQRAQTAI